MLYSFTVENWLSYKDETTLSMKASKERLHSNTLKKLSRMYGAAKVLPLAAIYGSNAAGKTAFFDALGFLQDMVIEGRRPDEPTFVSPFVLDAQHASSPTIFKIELVIEGRIYEYFVKLDSRSIIEERLSLLRSRSKDDLFHRSDTFFLGASINDDLHRAISNTVPNNQLFLHVAARLGSDTLKPIYDWFDKSLTLIGLNAKYNGYSKMMVRSDFQAFASEMLQAYAGISGLGLQELEDTATKEELRRFAAIRKEEHEKTPTAMQVVRTTPSGKDYYFVSFNDGEPSEFSKLVTQHRTNDGRLISFDISSESAGTQRLIDLMPAFFELEEMSNIDGNPRVFIVDELDRSFHTAMTHDLIRCYLEKRSENSCSQLIFNNHDIALMDGTIFRKDELWICSKDSETESSSLISVGSHEGVRSDTSIMKAYKENIFGGNPNSRI